MIQITSIQDILMIITFLFLGLYGMSILIDNRPQWFLPKRVLLCRKIQADYERLVSSRKDLIHHYYWALSNKENKKMKDTQSQILNIDNEIQELWKSYHQIKQGLSVPLRQMA